VQGVRAVFIVFAGMLLCLTLAACTEKPAPGPTAIVIDAETGVPVEGAIALAQWYSTAPGGLFEGSMLNLEKAQETYSDKDGRINMPDFWERFSAPLPRLTIYKPGYVLWDSKEICPFGKRTDFDEKHRAVKLLKFDTEAARWLKEKYDVGRGGPQRMQKSFFYDCYSGEMNSKYKGQIKFEKIFDEYEYPLFERENKERSQKSK